MRNKVKDPRFVVVIPIHGDIAYTCSALDSIVIQEITPFSIVITDSCSSERNKKYFADYSEEKGLAINYLAISETNFWTGAICAACQFIQDRMNGIDAICFMNNDTILKSQNTFTVLLDRCISKQEVVAPLVVSSISGRIINSGSVGLLPFLGIYRKVFAGGKPINCIGQGIYMEVSMVGFKCTFVPYKVIGQQVLPDEIKLPHYHADGEWCIRIQKDLKMPIVVTNSTYVINDDSNTGIGNNSRIPVNPINALKCIANKRSPWHIWSRLNFHKLTEPTIFVPVSIIMDSIKLSLAYINTLGKLVIRLISNK